MDDLLKKETDRGEDGIVRMSFLEHLDELRKRLMRSIAFVFLAFILCWSFSDIIYEFLSVPVRDAMTVAEQRALPVEGINGDENIQSFDQLKDDETVRYIFEQKTRVGTVAISPGASVLARKGIDASGNAGLFSVESIIVGNQIIPSGIRLPSSLDQDGSIVDPASERMVVTTAVEAFTLYVTVSLYAAIALSVPFLLWQIWGFISPALYRHERKYVTPFIFLSTAAFIVGAAFASTFSFRQQFPICLGWVRILI